MEQEVIDIKSKRDELIAFVTKWYDAIMGLPPEIRNDPTERTGIQVLIRQVGTRNQVFFPVYFPIEDAQVAAVEKGIRSELLGHLTSGESADFNKRRFPGSITLVIGEVEYQVSISGLFGYEDVALSIITLSHLTGFQPAAIAMKIIEKEQALPVEFDDESHYLYKLVFSYLPIDHIFMNRPDYTSEDILACGILNNNHIE